MAKNKKQKECNIYPVCWHVIELMFSLFQLTRCLYPVDISYIRYFQPYGHFWPFHSAVCFFIFGRPVFIFSAVWIRPTCGPTSNNGLQIVQYSNGFFTQKVQIQILIVFRKFNASFNMAPVWDSFCGLNWPIFLIG